MKTTRFLIATLICVGLLTAGLAAAASIPAMINYQGVLKDAAGAKIDGTVDIARSATGDLVKHFSGAGIYDRQRGARVRSLPLVLYENFS